MSAVTESSIALAQAEALSLAIRGTEPLLALDELRRRVGDPAVLTAASRRCLGNSHLDHETLGVAADLLATAAMLAREDRRSSDGPVARTAHDARPETGVRG